MATASTDMRALMSTFTSIKRETVKAPLVYGLVNFTVVYAMHLLLVARKYWIVKQIIASATLVMTLALVMSNEDGLEGDKVMQYIKFVCELPLGLGSVVWFLSLP